MDDTPVPADLYNLTPVALLAPHEFYAAAPVPVVVPIHKRGYSDAGVLRASKGPNRVVRSVFRLPQQGFVIVIIVRHPWLGEESEHTQLLQSPLQRVGTDGCPVLIRLMGGVNQVDRYGWLF